MSPPAINDIVIGPHRSGTLAAVIGSSYLSMFALEIGTVPST